MKIRIDNRITAALMGCGALLLSACQGALAVVDDLDNPGSGAGSAGSGSTPPPSGSCECGSSGALQALTCDGRPVALLDNDVVQTTADGSVVAFNLCDDDSAGGSCEVFYWDGSGLARSLGNGRLMIGLSASGREVLTAPGNLELIHLDGPATDLPLGMLAGHGSLSADGDSVVGGYFGPDNLAFLARADGSTGQVELLQQIEGYLTRVFVTPDGAHITGFGQDDIGSSSSWAFRWNEQDGFSYGLPNTPAGVEVWPEAISSDGSAIAGRALPSQSHFFWSESDGYTEIATASWRSETFISADGSVVLGSLDPEGNSDTSAFRWTRATGAVEIAPGIPTLALDMSDDGNVIAANSWEDAQIDGEAPLGTFIWDSTNGTRSLQEILQARGADTTGWKLGTARVLSGDGKVLFGRGECGGVPTLYRVVLSD
jgi:hypothetical protein